MSGSPGVNWWIEIEVEVIERVEHNRPPELGKAVTASLILGLFCLFVVPVYFAFNPVDSSTLRSLDGVAIGNIVLFAGESPAGVFLGVALLPLLLWPRITKGRTAQVRVWVATGLSLLFAVGQVGAAVFAVTDRSVPIFQPAPGCTLITCGIYHTLFHLFQAALLLVVAYFSYGGHRPSAAARQHMTSRR